jgi:hypothetical protein
MVRNTRKTEIYSLSVADGSRALLFSDEGMNLEIKAPSRVSGAGKAYAVGVWREWRTTPTRGVHSEEALYEIALDRSNHYHRVVDAQPNQPPAILNPQSTKAALEMFVNGNFVVSIYAIPEWKLLHNWDLTKLTQTHCAACTPISFGWLADGNRPYVQITVVGDEDEDSAKTNEPGTYIFSEDGSDLGGISPETGALQVPGYIHPKFIERQFLGQLPDGRYLFLDYGAKRGESPGNTKPFLVISGPEAKVGKPYPLHFPIGTVYPSPSGKYVAYLEERRAPNHPTELHLWFREVESGAEKEVFAAPPPNPPSSPEPNVTLRILGWISDK